MLKQRIITALMISLPLVAILFLMPPLFSIGLFALIVMLGAWEWSGFLSLKSKWHQVMYVFFVFICLAGAWYYWRDPEYLPLVLQIALLWWVSALVWIKYFPIKQSSLLRAVAGCLTLIPAWIAIGCLVNLSPQWLLFMFLIVIATDVGGYLFGRRFGRTKLAPLVSPGKTWEGVIGGVSMSMLIIFAGAYWFDQPLLEFLTICLFTVVFSVVGDLTESLFKRHAALKDSGSILPGHGGVLDRIDSMTAAAPVFLYGLMYLGVFVPS